MSPVGKARRIEVISLLHMIGFQSMGNGNRPVAEFSFKAEYSQGLSIWCLCFVMLSAFKAVIGSISYMTLNLAIEAIFS